MLLPFVLAAAFPSVDLDNINVERARSLAGRPVVASFVVSRPTYYHGGRTMAGGVERDDNTERGAVLIGRRPDVEMGKRVAVLGRLRVIDHPPGFVGGVLVPGWVEVRVEEVRR